MCRNLWGDSRSPRPHRLKGGGSRSNAAPKGAVRRGCLPWSEAVNVRSMTVVFKPTTHLGVVIRAERDRLACNTGHLPACLQLLRAFSPGRQTPTISSHLPLMGNHSFPFPLRRSLASLSRILAGLHPCPRNAPRVHALGDQDKGSAAAMSRLEATHSLATG